MGQIQRGAPRIVSELALLEQTVAESTVARYMVRHRPLDPNQGWKTFLRIPCDPNTHPSPLQARNRAVGR